jgi:hypothetical protein
MLPNICGSGGWWNSAALTGKFERTASRLGILLTFGTARVLLVSDAEKKAE